MSDFSETEARSEENFSDCTNKYSVENRKESKKNIDDTSCFPKHVCTKMYKKQYE